MAQDQAEAMLGAEQDGEQGGVQRPRGRRLSAHLEATVEAGTDLALLIAPAHDVPAREESFVVTSAGEAVEPEETTDPLGNRLHLLRGLAEGPLTIDYSGRVDGLAPVPGVTSGDPAAWVRPSRYCEVDELGGILPEIVGERTGAPAAAAIGSWVHDHLSYVPGSSTITDSARSTYLSREGVCRDYAHLTATLLRAAGIPARCTSVYAPGLSPMDFHLVVEVLLEDGWRIMDTTHLAPRASMVRIATGWDAADTAFMTTLAGHVSLTGITVMATADPELPREDPSEVIALR